MRHWWWVVVACGCHFRSGTAAGDATPGADADAPADAPADVRRDGGIAFAPCEPLAPATGTVLSVIDATTLNAAISIAMTGDTIELRDGTYDLSTGTLILHTDGLTLRSMSGNAANVVLDGGANSQVLVKIASSNVTLASLTLTGGTTGGIIVEPYTSTAAITGTVIYDVKFADVYGPAMAMRPFGGNFSGPAFADNGVVACSRFTETSGGPAQCAGAGVQGILGHGVRGWAIRDNQFQHLTCSTSFTRAVWIKEGSRDITFLRNHIFDSAGAVTFGDMSPNARTYGDMLPAGCGSGIPQVWGGTLCDNVIDGAATTNFDDGIALWTACDTWALHNTVVPDASGGSESTIEYRFPGTYVHLVNNLVGLAPLARDSGTQDAAYTASNAVYSATTDFTDVATGDLHLVTGATEGAGTSIASLGVCASDGDGVQRTLSAPRVGAYER